MIWSTAMLGPFPSLAAVMEGGLSQPLSQTALVSAADVTDIPATFLADPFLLKSGGQIYIYSEILNNDCQKGEIGLHTTRNDRRRTEFQYQGIVLREQWHLSFPFVIAHQNKFFMTTCTSAGFTDKALYLYEADRPEGPWRRRTTSIQFPPAAMPIGHVIDPVLFHHAAQKTWFLFFFDDGLRRERLYVADDLLAKWQEHPDSGKYAIRHSGKIQIDENGKMWCFDHSGSPRAVDKIEIGALSRQSYIHRSTSPMGLRELAGVNASRSWGEEGMHTFNSVYDKEENAWYAVIDGWWNDKKKTVFSCLFQSNTNARCHTAAGHLGEWAKPLPAPPGRKRSILPAPSAQNNAVKTLVPAPPRRSSLEKSLRVLILTMNRPKSLERLLVSLKNAVYRKGEIVHVDIWIDKPSSKDARSDSNTVQTANAFQKDWKVGTYAVHIREKNAGLAEQWLDAWRLSVAAAKHPQGEADFTADSNHELAVFLEDDLEVSPYFSEWLRRCHAAYDYRPDFAACTLQRASLCAADNCHDNLKGGPKGATSNFFYPLLGTWGFSPSARHWSRFTKWARTFIKSGAKPYVEGLTPTAWYRQFERQGRCPGKNCMWSILHIKYVSEHKDKMTCYARAPGGKTLAANHREAGLHYSGDALGPDAEIMTHWASALSQFPTKPSVLGWGGSIDKTYVHPPLADWNVVQQAVGMSSNPAHTATTRGYVSVIIINRAFLSMAKSWLCNTEYMKGVWESTLFVCTSGSLAKELGSWSTRDGRRANVVVWDLPPEMNGAMKYGDLSYYRLMLRRLSLYVLLARSGVNFLIAEVDSVWGTNVLQALTTTGDTLPSVMPGIDEHTHMMGFCLVSAGAGSVHMYETLQKQFKKKLDKYRGVHDPRDIGDAGNEQHLFSEYLDAHKSGEDSFSFRAMPNGLFMSGVWYKEANRRKCPVPHAIQNNWIIGNAAKVARAKRFGQWYLASDGETCAHNSLEGVRQSIGKHVAGGPC